jgi:LysR family transcriptional regulator, carnitine catabolism transcriptional activator
MAVTLARLRTFIVLAQTKSFDKTGKIVNRSQPAITEQIRSLEAALGIPLFHRQTRSVTLTPEGEILYPRVERVLLELDDLLRDFAKVVALETGEVRVGATPTLACYLLPEIIGSFRKRHPGIRVVFSDETAARLEKMVEERQLDFYFGAKPSSRSNLRFQFVAEDKYVIVVPKSHVLAKRGCRKVQQLAQYPMLLMSRGTNVRDHIDDFFKRHGLMIKPIEEVSNHFTLGGLVQAGCGITLLPRAAHPVIAHPGTVAIDIPDPSFVRVLGVATRPDYKPAPAAKAFLSVMIPLVREILLGGPARRRRSSS